MKTRIILACLAFAAPPAIVAAAPVEVVPAESVGMSSDRLGVLKERLTQELEERKTGGIQVLDSRRGLLDVTTACAGDERLPLT